MTRRAIPNAGTRRSLTVKERRDMWAAQGGACAQCGTGLPLAELEGEHYTPVFMGNDEKPDALWCRPCHADKTATDKGKIAKVKRIRGITQSQYAGNQKHKRTWLPFMGTWPSRKLRHPTLRKKVSGEVVRRD